MVDKRHRSAELPPLLFGRIGRMVLGLACLGVIAFVGPGELGGWGVVTLMVLGLSFLIGGWLGNPGCEITALPNLLLPSNKRIHCL